MKYAEYIAAGVVFASTAVLLPALSGCQTAERPHEVRPAASQPHEPADALAQSDAERAKAAIEQNQREMSGERRPHDPDRERVVDQPRVPDRH